VPDLDRALWSASNSLTLVVEDAVHPYAKVKDKGIVTRDMNLHALPWPREELELLQNANVEMRVTLSYFIEPNPSARGSTSKFHYPSHRLRFDVQRPLDASTDDFIARVNAAAQREDEGDAVRTQRTRSGTSESGTVTGDHCIRMYVSEPRLIWRVADSLLFILQRGGGALVLSRKGTIYRRATVWWSLSEHSKRRSTSTPQSSKGFSSSSRSSSRPKCCPGALDFLLRLLLGNCRNFPEINKLVRPDGFEPPTPTFVAGR